MEVSLLGQIGSVNHSLAGLNVYARNSENK